MIGIDIVSVARIERNFRRFGEGFLRKFLLEREIEILRSKGFAVNSIAGFWASKEACAKALGVGLGGEIGFYDICICYTIKGAPKIELAKEVASALNVGNIALSISHDGGFAVAAVMIEKIEINASKG